MVRQRLDEALNQEKRAMRCGLIKKRRELISDMVRSWSFMYPLWSGTTNVTWYTTFNDVACLPQLRVHRQRQKDLSGLSKGLEGSVDVGQHLQRWQNLLTAHSLELAELINNLDEEAAADIRKVSVHGACWSPWGIVVLRRYTKTPHAYVWSGGLLNSVSRWFTCSIGDNASDSGSHKWSQSHSALC